MLRWDVKLIHLELGMMVIVWGCRLQVLLVKEYQAVVFYFISDKGLPQGTRCLAIANGFQQL